MIKLNFLNFSLTIIICLICSCQSSTKNNKEIKTVQFPNSIALSTEDSLIIKNCASKIVSVDSLQSESGCSKIFEFYNIEHKLILQRKIQKCLADSRVVWQYDTYINNAEKKQLQISFDMMNNILKVERF